MKAKVGDWISFQRNSQIVIAEVRYIARPGGLTYRKEEYFTNQHGSVRDDDVLEVRSVHD